MNGLEIIVKKKKYDLIVIDMTEELKINVPLNLEAFWRNMILMLDNINGILIRNGEHRNVRNFFQNDRRLCFNYYQCSIMSFGGNYCYTMVSYRTINVRETPVDLTDVQQELNEQFSLPLSYPPDPSNTCCCCCVLL